MREGGTGNLGVQVRQERVLERARNELGREEQVVRKGRTYREES